MKINKLILVGIMGLTALAAAPQAQAKDWTEATMA